VYVVVTATGAATLLTENTHYTVSGGDGSTGTVSLAGGSAPYGAPTALQKVVIVRNIDLLQETDFVNNEATDAEVAEDALDKLTMIAQQLDARIDLSFALAESDVSGASTVIPTPEASTLVGWNSAGTALQNYAASALSTALTTPFTLTLLDDTTAAAARTTLGAAASGANTDITSLAAGTTLTNPINTTQALTDGATINWNANSGAMGTVTLGGNRTFAAPTNLKSGGFYTLQITQDGTGSRTVTWNAVFKAQGGSTVPQPVRKAAAVTTYNFWSDGTNLYLLNRKAAPTRTVLTSGTAATYTTPDGATRIDVDGLGGGSGGSGGGLNANGGTSGAGGATSFTDGTLTLTGNGGLASANSGAGLGGTATGGDVNARGAAGQTGGAAASGAVQATGGAGGPSHLGGNGNGNFGGGGVAALANSGSGGGAGSADATNGNYGGCGGASGGRFIKRITAPSASYTYTIGAAGTAGAAGTNGAAGGVGGTGVIIIDEYYD
jgi:hypothetical protein